VLVYSEADAHSLPVHLADEAICIGPAAARDSYLNIPAIMSAALISGAQAIHPGYGFLSENAEFAAALAEAGIVFIGPPVTAIATMGDKITAKATVSRFDVPVVPGIARPGLTDAELLAAVHDTDVSIENSVAVYGNTVYFSNSGGLVQGWDLTPLRGGGAPTRVFRYWTGDDTDASIVIDEEGMLYIGVEYERLNDRSRAVGQIIKLDPSRADPLVWKRDERPYNNAGVWATPALYRDIVIYATDEGKVLGLDRATVASLEGDTATRIDAADESGALSPAPPVPPLP